MKRSLQALVLSGLFSVSLIPSSAHAASSYTELLRDGLLGAGVGAISAGTSGGKAGKGALIGAGTSVLGNVIFSLISDRPHTASAYYAPGPIAQQPIYQAPVYQTPTYSQPTYQTITVQQPVVSYRTEKVLVQQAPAPVYNAYAPQTDFNKRVLRQGLLGAGVGAISAEVSGGKAGTGALLGAGSNVLGEALFGILLEQ